MWWAICHGVYKDNRMHRLARAVFFSQVLTYARARSRNWHMRAYTKCIFEQKLLCVLAELNTIEITHIVCARISTHDFPSSLNRAVLHMPPI